MRVIRGTECGERGQVFEAMPIPLSCVSIFVVVFGISAPGSAASKLFVVRLTCYKCM